MDRFNDAMRVLSRRHAPVGDRRMTVVPPRPKALLSTGSGLAVSPEVARASVIAAALGWSGPEPEPDLARPARTGAERRLRTLTALLVLAGLTAVGAALGPAPLLVLHLLVDGLLVAFVVQCRREAVLRGAALRAAAPPAAPASRPGRAGTVPTGRPLLDRPRLDRPPLDRPGPDRVELTRTAGWVPAQPAGRPADPVVSARQLRERPASAPDPQPAADRLDLAPMVPVQQRRGLPARDGAAPVVPGPLRQPALPTGVVLRPPRPAARIAGIPDLMPARPAPMVAAVPAPAARYEDLLPAVPEQGDPWSPVAFPVPTYVGKPMAPVPTRRVLDLTHPGRWSAATDADQESLGSFEDESQLADIVGRRRAAGDW